MEVVLRIIGGLAVIWGCFGGWQVVSHWSGADLALSNLVLVAQLSGSLGAIVGGVLFLAFGTIIELLRDIRRSLEGPIGRV